jgi:hypothetical protein
MNIYISMRGEQKGPYALSQVEAMWKNGSITADALYWVDDASEWRPIEQLKFSAARSGSRLWSTVFFGLIGLVVALVFRAHLQNPPKPPPSVEHIITSGQINAAADLGIKRGRQILAFRKETEDTLAAEFSKKLTEQPQSFLDEAVYQSLGGKLLGIDRNAPSGVTATAVRFDSINATWPDGARPNNVDEAIDQMVSYTATYTIYWKSDVGSGTGHYQFEHVVDAVTTKTVSIRMTKADGSTH